MIQGGGSKAFYGNPGTAAADVIDTRGFSGIVTYEPAELIMTVHAGTPLAEIESALKEQNQMLPFEPPHFGPHATLGGCVAAGLSGPRRPFAGAVRDHVLGVRLIDGRGERLKFGAEVIKNVAGFDVSRLMVGALGTLGLITEVSVKVVPMPKLETTLVMNGSGAEAVERLKVLRLQPWPISGTAFIDGQLCVRFSGSENAVHIAMQALVARYGGVELEQAETFWRSLRDQTHAWFNMNTNGLWRLSVRPDAPFTDFNAAPQIMEWSGALRWLQAPLSAATSLRQWAQQHGGHATLFRAQSESSSIDVERFTTPPAEAMRLHQQIKQTFDPDGLFNPGRLFRAL